MMAGPHTTSQKQALANEIKKKRDYDLYAVGAGDSYEQHETLDAASYADFVFFNVYPQLTQKLAPRMSKAILKGIVRHILTIYE